MHVYTYIYIYFRYTYPPTPATSRGSVSEEKRDRAVSFFMWPLFDKPGGSASLAQPLALVASF